ncbi:hypothetical protein J4Q44_G00390930 [Coregonus suidteri]|uniref:Uncharacterized protein n=1 Tax=Coregonus suidteri TaxID=861788 RepID=A0AAN8QBS7_9TELE
MSRRQIRNTKPTSKHPCWAKDVRGGSGVSHCRPAGQDNSVGLFSSQFNLRALLAWETYVTIAKASEVDNNQK